MPSNRTQDTTVDWSLTTREGARREQLRCRAALPLEDVVHALEEMEELAARRKLLEFQSPFAEGAHS